VRPAEVFVRSLEPVEARKLKRLATDGKHRSTRIRAMILLASATEMSAPQLAQLYLSDAERVRKVIHDFNARGFGALDPDVVGPAATVREARELVAALRPDAVLLDVGLPDRDGGTLARRLAALPWRPQRLRSRRDDARGRARRGAVGFVAEDDLPEAYLPRLLAGRGESEYG
jgi:CheY-like chemotaxis protein